MVVFKSAIGALLAGLFVTVAAPPAIFQDPGPGRADDVAELLPADTLFFAELVKAPYLLRDWKEHVGSFTTPEGKEEFCKQIEESVSGLLDKVPEKLLKDLKEGLPTLQRLAVAVMPSTGDEFPWAVVATSNDPAFFGRILDEDLKVFAAEEKVVQGVKVLGIRKLGDVKLPAPLLVAAAGKRMILTTHWDTLQGVIDRASGKAKGADLRSSKLYGQLTEATGEDPRLRAFCSLNLSEIFSIFTGPGRRRTSAFHMDQADAVFEFRNIRGYVAESTIRPGRVESRTRIIVESPCRLFDAVRQPPGPKNALAYIPEDANLAAHLNLKGGSDILRDVEGFIERFQKVMEIAGKAEGREDDHRKDRNFLDEGDEEVEREIGVTVREIGRAVGKEIAFAMVGEDAFAGEMNAVKSLLFAVHAADPAKARKIVETVTGKLGGYDASKEGAADLWVHKGEEPMPCFGIDGDIVVIAVSPDVLKKAVAAKATGASYAKRIGKAADGASGLASIRHSAILQIAKSAGAPITEELEKKLKLDGVTTVVGTYDKDGATATCVDPGLGLVLNTVTLAAPAAALAVPMVVRAAFGGPPPETDGPLIRPGPEVAEGPKLKPEELAKAIKENVAKLTSEEMVVRDDGLEGLRKLGRQAIPLLVEILRKETDPEVKNRLTALLLQWKAFKEMPELIDHKVEAFIVEWANRGMPDPNMWGSGYVFWQMTEAGPMGFFQIEPYRVNESLPRQLEHGDLLDSPEGMARLAARLASGKLEPQARKGLAMLFAFRECRTIGAQVAQALQAESDAETRAYLHAALGWSREPKAVEALSAGLRSADTWIRRASFIGAERTQDPAIVSKLAELLKDENLEIRWNAGFTLKAVLNNRVRLNMFVPEPEYDAQLKEARAWWEANKATYKFAK